MQTETLLILLAAILVVAGLVFLLRRKSGDADTIEQAPGEPTIAAPAAPPPTTADREGNGITDEIAAAAEDLADQLLQIDSHHDVAQDGPADELTRLKGLGPKAAARLNELGIRRYAQIAAWNDDDIARYDAQLGAFKGRIVRDRWVEQARYLASDDVTGFEATFGKLG